VASGAVAGSQEAARPEEPPTTTGRHASSSPVSPSDIGFCTQCHGPREYCHGHTSPVPTPVPAPVNPVPIPAPSTSPVQQWHTFASLVKKPCLWQTTLPTPSKSVMKIPLKYRLPTPKTNKLPKGWVYNVAEVKEEGHANPSCCTLCHAALTCHAQRGGQALPTPIANCARATNITEGQVTSLSLFRQYRSTSTCQVHQGPHDHNPYVEAQIGHGWTQYTHGGRSMPRQLLTAPCQTCQRSGQTSCNCWSSYQDWMMVDDAIAM
jgi:hypothetical protein